ncbi:hypothetical protein LP420_21515 [Massilia sp. B-10]|nr:hypothetical protein LP420_21515 [Massilia sp. B-10]
MIGEMAQRGWVGIPELTWPAIKAALDSGKFSALASAYQELTPLRLQLGRHGHPAQLPPGRGAAAHLPGRRRHPDLAGPLLAACMACHEVSYLHPLVDICARPFEPELFARIHPLLRDEVLTVLIENTQRRPASAPLLRTYAERHLASGAPSMALRAVMAEHLILCGRLDDAARMLGELDDSLALFYRSVILLLRDDLDAALAKASRMRSRRCAAKPASARWRSPVSAGTCTCWPCCAAPIPSTKRRPRPTSTSSRAPCKATTRPSISN